MPKLKEPVVSAKEGIKGVPSETYTPNGQLESRENVVEEPNKPVSLNKIEVRCRNSNLVDSRLSRSSRTTKTGRDTNS